MICIQLGSNKGDRLKKLLHATRLLEEKVQITKKGAVYISKAWGNTNQQDFYNQVLLVETTLNPYELLRFSQGIEEKIGREKVEKWGPRAIDIDIIFYDSKVIYSPTFQLPHAYMCERNFVLTPLAELETTWIHPLKEMGIPMLLKNCTDKSEVKRLEINVE